MTETEIKQMLAQGERLTLECKKAKTEYDSQNLFGSHIPLLPTLLVAIYY